MVGLLLLLLQLQHLALVALDVVVVAQLLSRLGLQVLHWAAADDRGIRGMVQLDLWMVKEVTERVFAAYLVDESLDDVLVIVRGRGRGSCPAPELLGAATVLPGCLAPADCRVLPRVGASATRLEQLLP